MKEKEKTNEKDRKKKRVCHWWHFCLCSVVQKIFYDFICSRDWVECKD